MTTLTNVDSWDTLIPGTTVWGERARVWTLGTHREYGYLLDARGNKMGEVEGTSQFVDYSPVQPLLPGNTVVHSHPDMSPLSPQDVFMATSNDLAYVVAVARDGTITASHGFNKDRVGPWITDSLASVVNRVSDTLSIYGRLDRREAISVALHHTWLKAAKEGITDYHYSIGPELQSALDRAAPVLRLA